MPLIETDFCIEQINVPPKLPMILKQFCKSAIRTQPYDLLKWSSAYFHALANGEEPPAKLRLEYPPACTAYGLTLGFLKVLLRQLGADYNKALPMECIMRRWDYLCLDRRDSNLIILIGKFRDKCQIKKFLSVGVGLLGRTITETMIMVCELFTHEPDGGSAMIPIGLFMEIYGYLSSLQCDGAEKASVTDVCVCSEVSGPTSTATVPSEIIRDVGPQDEPGHPASVTSQDTEADIEAELEFDPYVKHEMPSGMTLQSFGEESEGSYLHEGEASYNFSDRSRSTRSKSSENEETKKEEEEECSSDDETKKEEVQPVESKKDVISEASAKKETESVKSGSDGSKKSCSGVTEKTRSTSSSSSCPCYPDVPGIGRKLLAEEVASVAIWMSECARRQGGMVGPRNIRHVNCPPLEGVCCPQPQRCECEHEMDG